ncbi:MAG: 23S rRNA (adenine(2503)-C(2))-methyltransferase RlmN [Eubacteriaceae bacterium]|nr:23S rRNA (adenine(2503)-C(2))-methyltransferase RlmN [Eubacteriaceae bacterium]
MINLRDLTLEKMEQLVVSLGQPKFRAKQVFEWIYKGKTDFREMTNLPEVFRHILSERAYIGTVKPIAIQKSKTDGTRKYLFELEDGNTIESVFMKYKFGNSICVSSQAGCRMGCRFCASTRNGLERQLSPGEILSQIMAAEKDTGEKIGHIVVMGTGEPFDNYDNLKDFIKIVNHPKGLNIGMRNITVSTCGLVPVIEKFGEDFPQVNLAISLHGTTNEIRSSMMPVNNKYPLETLIPACRRYTEKTGRRITFEYTMVSGVNDSDDDAKRLSKMLKGMLSHVNIIPLNKVKESGFDTVSRKRAAEFAEMLTAHGITATVRRELGADIDAACGQLRLGQNTK